MFSAVMAGLVPAIPVDWRAFPVGITGAFPSEVETGSREENASGQRPRAIPVNRSSPQLL
ncbi:hypothetical protein CHELA20_51726 [Hyphomicrobiales bacterium]|nr:hypothetical protein CHELA41_23287 [Hyphomicrobiales bacterium]CAH1678071.1 hypothetical protein CHELA20_51726 [Hyphomicrobiales bacterium]